MTAQTIKNSNGTKKTLAIVIPVYNEEANIRVNIKEILSFKRKIIDYDSQIIIVNDGSKDRTSEEIDELLKIDSSISLLCLNRNFGKEAAILAGLSACQNYHATIVMDSDLQHPPVLFSEMLHFWEQGYQVVEACKSHRGKESVLSKVLVCSFYSLFRLFTKLKINNQSDFKLLDREVVKTYCKLYEQGRFFRGLVQWMNFSTYKIYFNVPESTRKSSNWNRSKLFKYAISSITSFSSFPLQFVTLMGMFTFLMSISIGAVTLFNKFTGQAVDGFSTVILLLLIIGSVLMFSLGLIGVYIAKIYDEVKHRPAYIINTKLSKLSDKET